MSNTPLVWVKLTIHSLRVIFSILSKNRENSLKSCPRKMVFEGVPLRSCPENWILLLFFSLRENFLLMCGFLLRPKQIRLYRIKYCPGYFSAQNNIILGISEKISSFETAQNWDITKKSSFRALWYYEYSWRVFYSIEAKAFGTQEKTAYGPPARMITSFAHWRYGNLQDPPETSKAI